MLKENKITNVVTENNKLKAQIKDLILENHSLSQKVNEIEDENNNLKQTIELRPSLLIENKDNGTGSHRDMSRVFEALDLSIFDNSRMSPSKNKITNI